MRKLILVTSNTCPACKRLQREFWMPKIAPFLMERAEHVPVEGNFSRIQKMHIRHAPCIVLVDNGAVKAKYYGSAHPTATELIEWVTRYDTHYENRQDD